MKIITIYHNPQCTRSRQALAALHSKGNNVEVIEYLKVGLSPNDIKAICQSLGMNPTEVIRIKEKAYQPIAKIFENADYDKQCELIAENPILLERPIIISAKQAVIARSPEKIKQILE